jgi:DHA1 family tetracycline resistance protein-like MFS transporter
MVKTARELASSSRFRKEALVNSSLLSHDKAMSKNPRKASHLFIFATIAIDAIGLGIIIPVLPDVIRRFVSEEAIVSRTYGLFIATYALLQFVASPLLGRLSDRFGRRPILLVSLLGAALDYLFMAFAPTLPLLWVGRVISGLTGASFTVASAYLADISDDSNRSRNFGMIGAGFGLGFIIGPAVGGLIGGYGSHYAFLAAGAFNLLNFLFGVFVLPESLSPDKRRPITRESLNPFRALSAVFKMPAIRALAVANTLMYLGGQTHPSIWTLYTQHRYGWTASQVGLSLTFVGVLNGITQGGLTGWMVKKLGERTIVVSGSFLQAIAFVLFGFASQPWMLYVVLMISAPLWSVGPAIQSLISREVSADRQGELQGSLMSLVSLATILNPLIMTNLFSMTSNRDSGFYFPGSPYFLAGVFIFIGWFFAWRWERAHRPAPTVPNEPDALEPRPVEQGVESPVG